MVTIAQVWLLTRSTPAAAMRALTRCHTVSYTAVEISTVCQVFDAQRAPVSLGRAVRGEVRGRRTGLVTRSMSRGDSPLRGPRTLAAARAKRTAGLPLERRPSVPSRSHDGGHPAAPSSNRCRTSSSWRAVLCARAPAGRTRPVCSNRSAPGPRGSCPARATPPPA